MAEKPYFKMTNLYIALEHQQMLALNQLDNFEAIWDFKIDWFEEPNERRGGWSGVGRLNLKGSGHEPLSVFVKKQQNHGRKTLRHPLTGEPTFKREFERLKFLQSHQFAAPQVVFYAESNRKANQRAILVTVALDEYVPLDSLCENWLHTASQSQKTQLMIKVAKELRRFHDMGLVHRALYPKHIFVKNVDHAPEIALIDLEKARFNQWFILRAIFDLASLNRHAEGWRRTQRLAFFKHYMNIAKLRFFSKCMCRLIIKRAGR